MRNRVRGLTSWLLAAAAAVSGCDGGGGYSGTEPPALTTVDFVYVAPTTTSPDVAAAHPGCVQGVGVTHLHPSWESYAARPMVAAGDRWTLRYGNVPVGVEHRFRINDPNGCVLNPTGAVTTNISANGVLLTRGVLTPGSGDEPGLAFTVSSSGVVTP